MSIYSTGMYLTEWWKSIIITCNILKSIAQPQFLFQIQIFISGYRGEPWYTILKVDLGFPLIVSVLVWFWPDTTLVYCVLALWGGKQRKNGSSTGRDRDFCHCHNAGRRGTYSVCICTRQLGIYCSQDTGPSQTRGCWQGLDSSFCLGTRPAFSEAKWHKTGEEQRHV